MIPFILNTNKENIKIANQTNTQTLKENKKTDVVENNNSVEAKQKTSIIAEQNISGKTNTQTIEKSKEEMPAENKNKTEQPTSPLTIQKNDVGENKSAANSLVVVAKTKTKQNDVAINKETTNHPAKEKNNPVVLANNSNTIKEEKTSSIIAAKSVETKKETIQKTQNNNLEKNTIVPVSKNQEEVSANKSDKQEVVSKNNIQSASDSVQTSTQAATTNAQDSATKKVDVAAVTPTNTIAQQPEKENPIRKNIFSMEVGASYMTGWNYGNTTEGKGFDPIAGLGFTHVLNSKWSVHTAAYYNSIGHLSSSSYTSSHTKYDFGYNTTDTSITTKWLHYITVPLQLKYNLNEKNYIGAGGSVSYLITSSGTMTTYNQNAFAITNKKEVVQNGYSKGFNTMNASVMVMYGRKLSKRFSANLIVYYGLMDLKDNLFFSQQKFERDMGARIMLSYNIFK